VWRLFHKHQERKRKSDEREASDLVEGNGQHGDHTPRP
jgi:hypothetical protein